MLRIRNVSLHPPKDTDAWGLYIYIYINIYINANHYRGHLHAMFTSKQNFFENISSPLHCMKISYWMERKSNRRKSFQINPHWKLRMSCVLLWVYYGDNKASVMLQYCLCSAWVNFMFIVIKWGECMGQIKQLKIQILVLEQTQKAK